MVYSMIFWMKAHLIYVGSLTARGYNLYGSHETNGNVSTTD